MSSSISSRGLYIDTLREDHALADMLTQPQIPAVTEYLRGISMGIELTAPYELCSIPLEDPIMTMADKRIHPDSYQDIIDLDYCDGVKDIYSVVKDAVVLEIAAARVRFVEHIYNYYGIARYTGVEPMDEWFMAGNRTLKSKADFKWNMVCSDYESYDVKGIPDVVVCCGLSYHLHSPFHLWEWLANTNAQYIILETTGTPGDNHLFAGANTTHNTMERITEQITELGSMEAYLALPRHMGVNSEVLNIPGNMQTTKKRSIPWKLAGINPDLKVLAFSEMGYDLDASNERIGGLCRSKRCVTTYRFKRRD